MERSDALKIVKKLGLRLPFLAKNLEMQAEWAQDIYEDFGGHSYDWVIAQAKDILKKHGSEYDIKLDWLIGELRCRVNLKRYLALPAPEDEEVERIPVEQAAANIAQLKEIVRSAKLANPYAADDESDIFNKVNGQSCDDLEEDSLKTDRQTLEG